jgi:hypothetical protein
MDREKEGSIFRSSFCSSIRLERRSNKSFSFKIIKSVNTDEVEIPYSIWELFGKSKGERLLTFLV